VSGFADFQVCRIFGVVEIAIGAAAQLFCGYGTLALDTNVALPDYFNTQDLEAPSGSGSYNSVFWSG
jgi:hypothetical protein